MGAENYREKEIIFDGTVRRLIKSSDDRGRLELADLLIKSKALDADEADKLTFSVRPNREMKVDVRWEGTHFDVKYGVFMNYMTRGDIDGFIGMIAKDRLDLANAHDKGKIQLKIASVSAEQLQDMLRIDNRNLTRSLRMTDKNELQRLLRAGNTEVFLGTHGKKVTGFAIIEYDHRRAAHLYEMVNDLAYPEKEKQELMDVIIAHLKELDQSDITFGTSKENMKWFKKYADSRGFALYEQSSILTIMVFDKAMKTESEWFDYIRASLLKKPTVLFIEDDESVSSSFVRYLKTFNLHVLVAKNYVQGMSLYRQNSDRIGLAITDDLMPRDDSDNDRQFWGESIRSDIIRYSTGIIPVIWQSGDFSDDKIDEQGLIWNKDRLSENFQRLMDGAMKAEDEKWATKIYQGSKGLFSEEELRSFKEDHSSGILSIQHKEDSEVFSKIEIYFESHGFGAAYRMDHPKKADAIMDFIIQKMSDNKKNKAMSSQTDRAMNSKIKADGVITDNSLTEIGKFINVFATYRQLVPSPIEQHLSQKVLIAKLSDISKVAKKLGVFGGASVWINGIKQNPELLQRIKRIPGYEWVGDKAQITPGGIDMNPAQMSMQIKRSPTKAFGDDSGGRTFGDDNSFSIDPAQVTGVTFIIRTMTPVTNLPQILGLNQESADKPKPELWAKA